MNGSFWVENVQKILIGRRIFKQFKIFQIILYLDKYCVTLISICHSKKCLGLISSHVDSVFEVKLEIQKK